MRYRLLKHGLLGICVLLAFPSAGRAKGHQFSLKTLPSFVHQLPKATQRRILKAVHHYAGRGDVSLVQRSSAHRSAETQLRRTAEAINRSLRKVAAERPVLIIVEGLNGAGKTSLQRRLVEDYGAFAGLDLKQAHFGAPQPVFTDKQWLDRYDEKLPSKPGEVALWDRSQIGRYIFEIDAYPQLGKKQRRSSLKQMDAFEKQLAARGIAVIKLFLVPSKQRQIERNGKRIALQSQIDASDAAELLPKQRDKTFRRYAKVLAATSGVFPWQIIPMGSSSEGPGRYSGNKRKRRAARKSDQELWRSISRDLRQAYVSITDNGSKAPRPKRDHKVIKRIADKLGMVGPLMTATEGRQLAFDTLLRTLDQQLATTRSAGEK
ncbi:MAG: hypothetical protein H6707_15160 [Deltaproteobacteria bacterium]|nr:hypothetical protein [Deltaproteobacteria bacterium]